MPSPTDFNLSPYYDDFAESKKFHRILFRPAFAVQARELTQSQTILQNQVEKLGDHFFEKGAMVIPGETHFDKNYNSIKLTSFTGTLSNFTGTTITGGLVGVFRGPRGLLFTEALENGLRKNNMFPILLKTPMVVFVLLFGLEKKVEL